VGDRLRNHGRDQVPGRAARRNPSAVTNAARTVAHRRYTMPVLTSQFEAALTNIEPSEDDKTNAPEVHSQVSDALGADAVIAGWGFSAILIGSYKRHVSIRRIKDVDVFGRLIDLPDDVLPSTLLSEFERVLKAAFPAVAGKLRVKRQSRSLQVSFPEYDGLYVDAVPARPWTRDDGLEAWQLPKRGEQEWQGTNPGELTPPTTGGDGAAPN